MKKQKQALTELEQRLQDASPDQIIALINRLQEMENTTGYEGMKEEYYAARVRAQAALAKAKSSN